MCVAESLRGSHLGAVRAFQELIGILAAIASLVVPGATFAATPELPQDPRTKSVGKQSTASVAAADAFAHVDATTLAAIRRAYSREEYADAERMARELLSQADSRVTKGRTYWATEVWIARCRIVTRQPDAETWLSRAIQSAETIFGPEHANTASSLDELAGFYHARGRPIDAEPLYRRALAIREKTLGEWHPETADNLAALGNLLTGMGNYDGARPLLERALDIRRHAHGGSSKEVLDTQFELARLAHVQRRYGDAERVYKRVLAGREVLFGAADPGVATTLEALAALNMEQGRTPLAEEQLKRVLTIRERTRGQDHWETLATLNELIRLYQARGNQSAARPLMDRAQAILRANAARHRKPEASKTPVREQQ